MKNCLCCGQILCLLLCLLLVDERCAQRSSGIPDCPDGTRCLEKSKCRKSVLKSLTKPARYCGLTSKWKQKICCPERKQSPGPTFTPPMFNHVPITPWNRHTSGSNGIPDCPDGTRCLEKSKCRKSVLKSLTKPPRYCGLTSKWIQKICCPESKQSPGPTFTPPMFNHAPITPRKGCGEKGFQTYIAGGEQVRQGDYPWMVEIAMRKRDGRYDHICTGAMITKSHILSAAHCFERRDPTLYVARIGHIDIKKADNYSISRIEVPDTYSRGIFYDDIAVLTLSRDVKKFGFNPICLPESAEYVNLTGEHTTAAGWGFKNPGGPHSSVLMNLPDIPVISNQRCNYLHSQFLYYRRDFKQGLTTGFLCAGFLTTGKDTCGGDSGGPLMYNLRGHWYVVGVVSFRVNACGISTLPQGYTRVSSYLGWILERIRSRKS